MVSRYAPFYLGTHRPRWLEQISNQAGNVPLFISFNTLAEYKSRGDAFPKGLTSWALDSGAFTVLDRHGDWTVSPDMYGGAVYRFMEDIGTPPDFCAPQDMPCEPETLAKTGFTVADHQEFTTDSVLYLREEFPHAPWIPVVQGYRLEEYLAHVEMYAQAGIDLTAEPLVGLGSVCRRQSTAEIGVIAGTLHAMGIKLHGFGVKREGLARYGHCLTSSDSLAWSRAARYDRIKLAGCEHRGPCQNCMRYALQWREQTLAALRRPQQSALELDFTVLNGAAS